MSSVFETKNIDNASFTVHMVLCLCFAVVKSVNELLKIVGIFLWLFVRVEGFNL
jgi:hypothetical protein